MFIPLCGGMGDWHHSCAADKSAETTWCYHVNNQSIYLSYLSSIFLKAQMGISVLMNLSTMLSFVMSVCFITTRWCTLSLHLLYGPRLAWFPSSCSVTIEWDAIHRSICFIIWSPDVQNRGIQFLLKFTSKRCVEQNRKGKYVHPMGDGSHCNICSHAVCPSNTHTHCWNIGKCTTGEEGGMDQFARKYYLMLQLWFWHSASRLVSEHTNTLILLSYTLLCTLWITSVRTQ